jgi:peroxiredoxin
MVPLFVLSSTAGGSTGPGALRSKYNMVLTFLGEGEGAATYLRALSNLYPRLLGEQARVIAVATANREIAQGLAADLRLPFPMLVDDEGTVTTRMLGEHGAAFCIADRFGSCPPRM